MKKLLLLLFLIIGSYSSYAQWKSYGPSNAISGIIEHNNVLMAVSWQNIFYSDTEANNWNVTKSDLEYTGQFYSISKSKNYVYVGYTSKLFRSSDQGTTWENISFSSLGSNNRQYTAFAYDDSVYVFGGTGILYVSPENKIKFDSVSRPGQTFFMNKINDSFYALISGKFLVSNNRGRNWTSGSQQFDTIRFNEFKIFNDEFYLISSGNCYKSSDFGKTWKVLFDSSKTKSQLYNIYLDNGRIILTSNRGLIYSEDEGKTWNSAGAGLSNNYTNDLIISQNYYYAGTKLGVYKSPKNAFDWKPNNTGLNNSFIENIRFYRDSIFVNTGGFSPKVNYVSRDEGLSWIPVSNDSVEHPMNYRPSPNIILSHNSKAFLVSTDNGNTWQDKTPKNYSPFDISNPIIFKDTIFYCSSDNKIHKLDTLNFNWKHDTITFNNGGCLGYFIRKGKLHASFLYQGLMMNNPTTHTWENVGVHSSYFDYYNPVMIGDRLFFTYVDVAAKKRFLYTDNLSNFMDIPTSNIDNAYFSYVVRNNELYYCIGGEGVSRSKNGGDTWGKFNNGLTNYMTSGIFLYNDKLYLTTQGGGVNIYDFKNIYSSPYLITPSNNSTKDSKLITFSWSKSSESIEEKFQLSYDAGFNKLVKDTAVKSDYISLLNLAPDKTFYWRVISKFENGEEKESQAFIFTTRTITNVENTDNDYITVFPNPATNSLTINAKSIVNNPFNVTLLNYLGEKTIVYNNLPANQNHNLDISNLPIGFYSILIDDGLRIIKKKIVITK